MLHYLIFVNLLPIINKNVVYVYFKNVMEGYVQKLGGVKRYVQFLEISDDPELVAQYRKWHSEEYSWKEVRDGIRAVGILEMEIYILGSKLVMIVDTPADFQRDLASVA